MSMTRQEYATQLAKLKKTPAYKAYIEEHRCEVNALLTAFPDNSDPGEDDTGMDAQDD